MRAFFNASVILAGIYSPGGASAVLLKKTIDDEIEGVISELIFDEAVRHSGKIGLQPEDLEEKILGIFSHPFSAPKIGLVPKFGKVVIDPGDAHVIASAIYENCDVLVTLDKKHLLILKGKIKDLEILSPGELLQKIK
ncbi:MAG: PIN domain-containing protein [Patescibacteria group bacterium]